MEVDHLGDLAETLTSPELYPMDENIIENLLASIDHRSWGVRRPAYFAYAAHRRHSVFLITA
ncbi:uncharacterized protein N7484_000994 [Penicillium longicatenatum]|uniref:uncharacterized protein n=1 Tax=Penicillium longicatenatum TaxID=1561947 RepID=UPI0025474C6E|nr:uncharacterized protein N7484_000994 [Penicillium longicatenatum]KAJ5657345.1 hypothetical protein N7484_000994 [Penicillium longicatenatum]